MITFIRYTFSVLDRPARVSFIAFALCSVVVAAIEALGVALIVPLSELLLTEEGSPSVMAKVDRFVSVSTKEQAAAVLAVLVLVTFTTKAVASIALLRWAIGNALRQEALIARHVFSSYLTAPATYHFSHNSSEIQRTLNEALFIVFRRSLPWVMASFADAFTLLAIAGVILFRDPPIALIVVSYFSVVAVVYQRWIGGRHKVAARRSHEEIAIRYQQVQEPLQATKDLAVLHRESFFVERFYQTKIQLADAQRRLVFYQHLPRHFLDLAFVLGAGLMAGFVFTTRSSEEALVAVGLFLTASFRLVVPLNRVMSAFTVARSAGPAIEQVVDDLRVLDELAAPPEEDAKAAPLPPCSIEFRDVHYRYGAELPEVLQGVSLRIEPGEDVAIVGATGAGKTTLLDILLGLLEPQAGQVLIGGRPMAPQRTSWHLSIGYVPQHVVLIDDTIRANVAFGVEADVIDESRLWEALRLAQIDEFVSSLDRGLDSPVGELGVRLSGGQRQRLGLARALYHRPVVLVLDEATSSLDADTERRVIETIASLRGALTIITVSHRLSTLKHCDRLYFLRRGRVGSAGTFDDLRLTEPEFAHLVSLAKLSHDDDVDDGLLPPAPASDSPVTGVTLG